VHRALKHALAAGLLRHRSGRYKVLATLNPVSAPDPSTSKKPVSNDPKIEEKKLHLDARAPIGGDAKSSRGTQERKYVTAISIMTNVRAFLPDSLCRSGNISAMTAVLLTIS